MLVRAAIAVLAASALAASAQADVLESAGLLDPPPAFAARRTSHELVPSLFWSAGYQVRLREPVLPSGPRSDTAARERPETVLLAGLEWRPSESLTFLIEGRDARAIQSLPGAAELHRDPFDLHRALAQLTLGTGNLRLRLRAGRQYLDLGAPPGAESAAAADALRRPVFNAVRASLGEQRRLELVAALPVPTNPHGFNAQRSSGDRFLDSGFYGALYTDRRLIAGARLDAYLLARRHEGFGDQMVVFGGRFSGRVGPLLLEIGADHEQGRFGGVARSAWRARAAASCALPVERARLRLSYTQGAGESGALADRGMLGGPWLGTAAPHGILEARIELPLG